MQIFEKNNRYLFARVFGAVKMAKKYNSNFFRLHIGLYLIIMFSNLEVVILKKK